MRTFTDNEFTLFEKICAMTEPQLFRTLKKLLIDRYDKVITDDKNYLVAIGNIDIALVAHLDTVFDTPAYEVYYDIRKGVCWSPQGLGADDRAGVFACLNIIQRGLKPSIIFTTGEESGGVGAKELAKLECPIPNLKYMIELDRQGENDMCFYQCYCPDFISYVESFGFLEKKGSYSDITFLMEAWHICGVNLSCGYQDEHSYEERLFVDPMFATINKVYKMLKEKNIPTFKYGENEIPLTKWYRSNSRDCDWDNDMMLVKCDECGEKVFDFEIIKVDNKNYCCDCAANYWGCI